MALSVFDINKTYSSISEPCSTTPINAHHADNYLPFSFCDDVFWDSGWIVAYLEVVAEQWAAVYLG